MKVVIRLLVLLVSLFFTTALCASSSGLKLVETANGEKSRHTRNLVQWTHSRLEFNKSLKRVAVGQDSTLQVEVLSTNEALVLAKKVGRTSLMVWYNDGSSETFLFSVVEDMTVLHKALHDIHPNLGLELAPDRSALVLRGLVPTIKFRRAAEAAARNYLDAGQTPGNEVVVQKDTGLVQSAINNASFSLQNALQAGVSRGSQSAIINLIQVEQLPLDLVDKVQQAINAIGGQSVQVKRIQRDEMSDDLTDTLMLSGTVNSQVDLVRILNVAAAIIGGNEGTDNNIVSIANESGGLINKSGKSSKGGMLSLNTSSGQGENNITSNIGRAKLLSAANGRLLSTIEVRDLPQVRVAVQMYEVNRRRLKAWKPNLSLISNGYNASEGLFGLGGASSRATGADQVENALQMLGGSLVNNLQVGSKNVAFDLLFSLMEQEGISRTLSRPTLTVLAGESAVFSAGGEVPVPTAFAPSGIAEGDSVGANTPGVFSGTNFKEFGVQLQVRAMVDENDTITLDLNPTISMPDTLLTQQIAASTGTALNTTAFKVRSINTSTRILDGQPLVIGGLVSRDISDNSDRVPGLNKIPLLGKLTESTADIDDDRELFIIVTPTIVRELHHNASIWEFTPTQALLNRALLDSRQRIKPFNLTH